jgi:predicted DNA-binding antitoxin AbrB/MazE fold protein
MNKIIQATYQDGNLVLDEKLDQSLEGRKLTLILVKDFAELQDDVEQVLEPRKQLFLEQLQQHSFRLPEEYQFNREALYEQ